MSVRAYIKEEQNIEYKNGYKEITYRENLIELFNIWHNPEIFEVLCEYGFDGTNQDSVGEIEIDSEQWEELKETEKIFISPKFTEKKYGKESVKIFKKIDSYLKENEYLLLNCY